MRGSMNTFFIVLLFCYVKCDKERIVQFFPVDSGRKTMSVTYWSMCLSNTSIKINISGPRLLTLPLNLLWINLQYWISALLILSTSTLISYCVLPLPGTHPKTAPKVWVKIEEHKETIATEVLTRVSEWCCCNCANSFSTNHSETVGASCSRASAANYHGHSWSEFATIEWTKFGQGLDWAK